MHGAQPVGVTQHADSHVELWLTHATVNLACSSYSTLAQQADMCQSDVARSNARRVGHLPELEGGDLVVAALVLHLPEHLVQVQLLVGEGGHLVLALGAAVPVDEQAREGVLVQPPHQVQHLLPCAWQA